MPGVLRFLIRAALEHHLKILALLLHIAGLCKVKELEFEKAATQVFQLAIAEPIEGLSELQFDRKLHSRS